MGKIVRNIAVGGITLCCAIIVALLALISVEVSVAVFSIGSIVYVITSEYKRRMQWEKAADFKFMKIHEKHDALAQKVDAQSKAPITRVKTAAQTPENVNPSVEKTVQKDVKKHAADNIRKDAVSFKSFLSDAPRGGESVAALKSGPLRKKPAPPTKSMNFAKDEIITRKTPKVSTLEDPDSLSDLVVEELMGHAVKNKQIDIFMQPVLRLPQRHRKFYEIFSRVRAKPGVYIPAGRYLDIANNNDQLHQIDTLLLTQCIDILRHSKNHTNPASFFINITQNTLKNRQFMGVLLAFLSKNRDLSGRLIFEMSQKEFQALDIPILKIISGLAKLGCAFSLDHVSTLDEDIADLQRFRVRFLKIDAALLIEAAKNERQYKGIMKSKRMLEGNGIGLIAEKIENEETMRALLDFDLHYGQGYLFGRPDLKGAYEPDLKSNAA